MTRRHLFGTALAAAAGAGVAPAQTTPSQDDDLNNARESIANNAALLATVEVPMATEPAFIFKAQ